MLSGTDNLGQSVDAGTIDTVTIYADGKPGTATPGSFQIAPGAFVAAPAPINPYYIYGAIGLVAVMIVIAHHK